MYLLHLGMAYYTTTGQFIYLGNISVIGNFNKVAPKTRLQPSEIVLYLADQIINIPLFRSNKTTNILGKLEILLWTFLTKNALLYVKCCMHYFRKTRHVNPWLCKLVWAKFHNTLIWLKFNPIYFMKHYTYFKQCYQECLKQNIVYLWFYINISCIC